jgi:AraC-like DNA-binding protein
MMGGKVEEFNYLFNLIPPRSQLNRLEPIGIGTPFVESLTSYTIRLANSHSLKVGDLIEKSIGPKLNKSYISEETKRSTFDKLKYINGVGTITVDFVNALEELTKRNDLGYLTMLSWQGIFRGRLLKDHKAWCPYCFEEWMKNREIIYEPLIWQIDMISTCFIHNVHLETQCRFCHNKLSFITRQPQIGYCPKCSKWLGKSMQYNHGSTANLELDNREWAYWIHSNISELIQIAPSLLFIPTEHKVRDLICQLINKIGTIKGFASYFDLSIGVVRDWKYRTIPLFTTLLKFSFTLKKSLYFLLSSGIPKIKKSDLQYINMKHLKGKKRVLETGELREKFKSILLLEKNPLPSTPQIAKRFGCSISSLKRHCKDLISQLSELNKDYKKRLKIQRINKICNEVEKITWEIHAEGNYPSVNKVSLRLSNPAYFRIPEAKKAWRSTIQKIKEGNLR